MNSRLELLRAKRVAWDQWARQFRKPNGWTVIPAGENAKCPCPFDNEERSELEILEFKADPPDRYFLYVNEKTGKATTFTGGILGTVSFGREFRDNFGGLRVPVRIQAVNGKTYSGTYYKSSGDYARVRIVKG